MSPVSGFTGECEICREPAVLRCTGCNCVFYCDRSHQKEDWINHRTNCLVNKVWQIRTCRKTGRHVVALRDIKKGEFLMTETPFVTGQHSFHPPLLCPLLPSCVGCYKKLNLDSPSFCPNCKWPTCDDNCSGVTDENYHATECFLFKFLFQTEKFQPWVVVLPLRCLLLQKLSPRKWRFLQEMALYADTKLVDRTKNDKLIRRVFNILRPLKVIALELLPDLSFEILKQVFAVLDVYAVNWSPGDDIEFGSLYPTISFLQHSCVANTRLYYGPRLPKSAVYRRRSHFKTGSITVQAMKDIPKGEILTLSWVAVGSPTIARQFQLFYEKNLRCFCERCLDPRECGTDFGTLKCSVCCGWMLPMNTRKINKSVWKCQKCQLTLSPTEVNAHVLPLSMGNLTLEEDASVEYLEELRTKFEKVLHPNHFLCFEIKMKLVKAYGSFKGGLYGVSDQDLNRKAELCRYVLNIRKKLGPLFVLEEIVDHAECNLQYARAQIELAKRASHQNRWDADRINRSLTESRALLQEALDLLENEPPLSAEHVNVSSRIQTAIFHLNLFEKEVRVKKSVT